MNFLNALNVLSMAVTLTACGQAPSLELPAAETAQRTSDEIAPVTAPPAAEEPIADASTPEPVLEADPVTPSLTVLTGSLTSRKICMWLQDFDSVTTVIRLTSANGYFYTFNTSGVWFTVGGPYDETPNSPSEVGYTVLTFKNQIGAAVGTSCKLTVQSGQIVSLE